MKVYKRIRNIVVSSILSLTVLIIGVDIYGYSGIHMVSKTGATDYTWMPNQWKTTMSEGFSWFRMDENGFNNMQGNTDDIDILLMGSSQMEAVSVGCTGNTAALLNSYLPYRTYNIGISAHLIYHCVNNLADAVKVYQPSAYVIIETDAVRLDEDMMQLVIDGNFDHIPSYDSGIFYGLQKYVPPVKTIYKNMKDWSNMGEGRSEKESIQKLDSENVSATYVSTMKNFLEYAKSKVQGQQLIFVYDPIDQIDNDGNYIETDETYRNLFNEECEKLGIVFVDMSDDFRELYEQQHVMAHGFSNTMPGSGHLNKCGHEAIAKRLAEVIGDRDEIPYFGK